MAISEIGVAFPDETFGNMSRFGVPFTFLLRDILQFDDVSCIPSFVCYFGGCVFFTWGSQHMFVPTVP
jgi:hypothetical protein